MIFNDKKEITGCDKVLLDSVEEKLKTKISYSRIVSYDHLLNQVRLLKLESYYQIELCEYSESNQNRN